MSQSPWGSNNWGEQAWGDNGIDVTFSASYGLGAWGEFAWGEGNLTDALSTNTGSVTIGISVGVDVTGIQLTGSVGDTTEIGDANVSVTGSALSITTGNDGVKTQ